MYAIVNDRGKQIPVREGERIEIDLLDVPAGEALEFGDVLFYKKEDDVRIGTPKLDGIVVRAKVIDPVVKGKKLIVFRFRRRKNSKKKNGHRQRYTRIQIESIEAK